MIQTLMVAICLCAPHEPILTTALHQTMAAWTKNYRMQALSETSYGRIQNLLKVVLKDLPAQVAAVPYIVGKLALP